MAETSAVATTPYWFDSSSIPRYPKLDRDIRVDVAIIGAGITGLTAAYLLKREQLTVAVLERGRVGGVDSSHTTAHVTCVTDKDLGQLVSDFGRDHAQAVWDAGLAAIDQIDRIIRTEGIECEWTWVPGYKHAVPGGDTGNERARLQRESALAAELGFDARFLDATPYMNSPGIEFQEQAKFHPRQYLAALAQRVHGDESHVFEHTASEAVEDAPLSVKANGHRVTCDYVVVATHTPLMGKTSAATATLLQTKLYLYTSYVVGGRLPRGMVPEALFWDTAAPYHYLRVDRRGDHDFVILGGEDHKTGQAANTTECFEKLEATARKVLPGIDITHHWSGQVVETNDGLPYIGESAEKQFVATGYAGNGMTFGTLAAMMARDATLQRTNPWRELFDIGRTKVRGGAWNYLKENVDYPYYMIRDRFAGAEGQSLRTVRRGEGKIVDVNGNRVAAWRAEDGSLTRLSPVCTHMGCLVGWNPAEKSWDCPCHGSRFTPTGAVLAGPAETPLEKVKE